jgi:hypothetical protein
MRDGAQDLRINPREACQLLGIGVVSLAIIVRYGAQLTYVRHDNLVTQFVKLFADPDRVRSASIATRAGGTSVNDFSSTLGVVLKRPRSTTSPSSLSMQ